MEDYEKEYNDFWKDIVENEDGTLNKDQVMRELYDYSNIIRNCTKAYCMMTGQQISKVNTEFFEVEAIFNRLFLDAGATKDDVKEILKLDNEAMRKAIEEYFEIEGE